jgi:hypothetical protein
LQAQVLVGRDGRLCAFGAAKLILQNWEGHRGAQVGWRRFVLRELFQNIG